MWIDNKMESKSVFQRLEKNLILDADSYKLSHAPLLPNGTTNASSYISARTNGDTIVPFGLQAWIKDNLLVPITMDNIDEAEGIALAHGEPFYRKPWETMLNKYDGYTPLTIRAIPEGTKVDSSTTLVVTEATDPEFAWLPSYLETSMQRGVWYPTTIASQDYQNYRNLKWFYDHGSDNPSMLDFALHSFGSRGVSSGETAMLGGMAHLIFFRGTDDLVSLRGARKYYNCDMAGYSVVATEHSIQCAYGYDGQDAYFDRLLTVYGKPGAIISAVMDGYDIYREVARLEKFKDRIIATGCKWVVRPDSGDMFEVVPKVVLMLDQIFGHTINSKGKKVLNNVGVIQGDGIDSMTLGMLSQKIFDMGYAPENVICGSGGGLLQKVNRDTFKFAQKTSAIEINGEWIDVVKDPITDQGKKSKKGRQFDDRMVEVYRNGELLIDDSLDVIRQRAIS